jgi:hypothetical protein
MVFNEHLSRQWCQNEERWWLGDSERDCIAEIRLLQRKASKSYEVMIGILPDGKICRFETLEEAKHWAESEVSLSWEQLQKPPDSRE